MNARAPGGRAVGPRATARRAAGGSKGAGPRVLIVENDPMSRELARRVLAAGGYEVTCANDAETALELAPRLRPDLVLMDLRLPGMDGVEATRRLRGNRATRSIPVAVLSAQAFSADAERARKAGCVEYWTKPIGARELLDRVGAVLGTTVGAKRAKPRAKRRSGT